MLQSPLQMFHAHFQRQPRVYEAQETFQWKSSERPFGGAIVTSAISRCAAAMVAVISGPDTIKTLMSTLPKKLKPRIEWMDVGSDFLLKYSKGRSRNSRRRREPN